MGIDAKVSSATTAEGEWMGQQFKGGPLAGIANLTLGALSFIGVDPHLLNDHGHSAEKKVYSGFAYLVDESGEILRSVKTRVLAEVSTRTGHMVREDDKDTILSVSREGYREGKFLLYEHNSYQDIKWEGRVVFSPDKLSLDELRGIGTSQPLTQLQYDFRGNIREVDRRLWPESLGVVPAL